jgi:acyl carrier protein phosphodiesterase
MKFTLRYMKQHNWLTAYATTEGIARSFQGLASRVPAGEILTKAPGVMAQLQTEINNAFGIFFPAIVRETKVKLGTFAAGW